MSKRQVSLIHTAGEFQDILRESATSDAMEDMGTGDNVKEGVRSLAEVSPLLVSCLKNYIRGRLQRRPKAWKSPLRSELSMSWLIASRWFRTTARDPLGLRLFEGLDIY